MSPMQWIVCEEGRRWAPALRMAASRASRGVWAVVEVRTLDELSARLAESSGSLALVEIRRATASSRLEWLRAASREFKQARFVALLDFASPGDPGERGAAADAQARVHFAGACTEAGATGVVDSPRRLGSAIEIGLRHAVRLAARQSRPAIDNPWGAADVWSALPWQDG